MKRLIKASETAEDVNRITIDFYGNVDLTGIEAASNPKRVFKNTELVIRDVRNYLTQKGLKVLSVRKSSNENSDSTYYDVDIRICNNANNFEFIYLRVSDHHESLLNKDPRDNYHKRLTRQYKNLPETDDVTGLYKYYSIVVSGKGYNNYNRAMNWVKVQIDSYLREEGII